MDAELKSTKGISRWLSSIMISAGAVLVAMNAVELMRGERYLWSRLCIPVGLLLSGVAGFLDPNRGRLYTTGTLIAVIVMFGGIVSSFLCW